HVVQVFALAGGGAARVVGTAGIDAAHFSPGTLGIAATPARPIEFVLAAARPILAACTDGFFLPDRQRRREHLGRPHFRLLLGGRIGDGGGRLVLLVLGVGGDQKSEHQDEAYPEHVEHQRRRTRERKLVVRRIALPEGVFRRHQRGVSGSGWHAIAAEG